MKTTHTPGPWNAHQPGFKGLVSGVVRDKQNRFVATTASPVSGEYNRDENEIDANARLIASAPELLKELQNLVDVLQEQLTDEAKENESIEEAIGRAQIVINKAN